MPNDEVHHHIIRITDYPNYFLTKHLFTAVFWRRRLSLPLIKLVCEPLLSCKKFSTVLKIFNFSYAFKSIPFSPPFSVVHAPDRLAPCESRCPRLPPLRRMKLVMSSQFAHTASCGTQGYSHLLEID